MKFEWDEEKNKKNIRRRGIGFNDVIPVFYDENAVAYCDNRYSYPDGERMVIIGQDHERLFYVAYADIEEGKIIRIISARLAEKLDIQRYQRGF